MKFESWRPGLLPPVVRFWNRAFAQKRNYFPVTERLFRERVLEKKTAVEEFDPEAFIVAREDKEVVGVVHVGERPEALVRTLDPEWPGGTQGYVAFLYVEPERRKKGIGSELWHRGLDQLRKARQVILDGQCWNPFYGNSEGPFTPFWGTPEGVSVEWDSSGTKKFLARKGYAPRFKGVQLALDLVQAAPPPTEAITRTLARGGFELRILEGEYPEVGHPHKERRFLPKGLDFECVSAVRLGRTVGLIASFPLKEVRAGLHAIYEANVVEGFRGRALGKNLLAAAIARMKGKGAASCEVLTIPEISPAAHKLYLAFGFLPAASWAIY
jgi:ribosomal protein S18 acetylase RimI-like enzyme